MTVRIIDFSEAMAAETSAPAADRLIAGNPQHQFTNRFTDSTEQFFSGIWSSTPGKWRIQYTENEFCCLTQGRVVLENKEGKRWEFGPGVGFVVPSGFEGTWEVLETCTKFYAIFGART